MWSIDEVIKSRVCQNGARIVFTGICPRCKLLYYKINSPFWEGYKSSPFCSAGCSNYKHGLSNDGYICRTVNRKRILQHREFMEKKLKRRLKCTEFVHHKNGDKQDNRLSNLELWERPHPPGHRVKDKK